LPQATGLTGGQVAQLRGTAGRDALGHDRRQCPANALLGRHDLPHRRRTFAQGNDGHRRRGFDPPVAFEPGVLQCDPALSGPGSRLLLQRR
jgi:hypothetical protein